jgi:hypothetical protein
LVRELWTSEVQNDWEGPGFGYTGNVDYILGTSNSKSVKYMDSSLLVMQAKNNGLMMPFLKFYVKLAAC